MRGKQINMIDKGLIKKLKERNHTSEATRQHFENSLHQYCRDVDYYVNRGWSEKEAKRYIKYWYGKNEK